MLETNDVAPLVKSTITVWNVIGFNLYSAVTNCGFNLTNDIAIESCIDQSRLLTIGGDLAAHVLCARLIREYGMAAVVAALEQHLQLT